MERKKEGMWFQTWSRYWDPSSDGQTQELRRPEGCPGESNGCSNTLAERTEWETQVISQSL